MDSEASAWDKKLLRQVAALQKEVRELREWREDMRPTLTAMQQLVKDAEYGVRARQKRDALWGRIGKVAVALTAVGTLAVSMLHTAGVV